MRNAGLTTAQVQLHMVRETEAAVQWERVFGTADGSVGICGVLGCEWGRGLRFCEVEAENSWAGRVEDLYMETSAAYNRMLRFRVALRRASGP